jgi:trigger factor
MKRKTYMAVLALCMALSMTACSTVQSESEPSSSEQKENAAETETDTTDSGQEENSSGTDGFGTRLVSVDNVEKYVSIAEYKGLNLNNTVAEITDEQVEEAIKYSLQGEMSQVTDSNETVKEGDLVTISYVGTVNGELLESEDYYDLTVGEGSMTDGFEEGLIGMKKGETRTLNLTFPEEFYSDELSGQDVVYKVTLQSFQRAPEIDDAYVAANTEASTLEEYTQMVRTQMEESAEAEAKENLRSIAWDTILTNSEVMEYPQADIDNAIDEYKRQIMEYNNDSELTLEEFVESQNMTMESFEEQCQQYAESKVKQNLIVQGIMDAEGLSLEDAQSLAIQDQLVEDFAVSSLAELIDAYGQSMIDEAIGLIRVEDFIVENANVEEYVSDGGLAGIDAGEGEEIFSDENTEVIENVIDEEE